jgi:Capsule assembly protein Wzi
MKRLIFFCFLLTVPLLKISCQSENLYFNAETEAGYISPDKMPFWLRSNQYGSIPLDNASLSLLGSARKDYDTNKMHTFDWGASFEGRLNIGNEVNFILVEGYGKMRLSVFELKAGRSKEVIGLCDTSLSSGSWTFSGNALGIPKVQLAIPDFYSIPLFDKILAFKGQYAFGWFGDIPMWGWHQNGDTIQIGAYLHHISFFGRFGKPSWKFKLYGGINHQVVWGNEKVYYGEDFKLSPFTTYLYVITGKKYNNGDIQETRIGNHMGSVDIGFEYEFKAVKLLIYRQNLYEAGALYHLANIQDGLNGLSIENKNKSQYTFKWKKFLFEFLYTKNQAGEPWSKPTPSPYEPYYNHGEYIQGWSYNGIGLGSPFITTRDYIRKELPTWPSEYFVNNRVKVFYLGLEGSIEKWDFLFKASFSNNYGTYATTDEEQTTEIKNPGSMGVFGLQDQFSAYIDCGRPLKKGLVIGGTLACDIGQLYYNSFGILLHVSKTF